MMPEVESLSNLSPALKGDLRSVVVTGGVACGKSLVMSRLEAGLQGVAHFFSADDAVHELMTEEAVIGKITKAFGREVLDGQGVDRKKLGARVFGDQAARRCLERILHPPVLEMLENEREKAKSADGVNLFVAEVPLHYEIGATVSADLVVVVASSREQQVQRLMESRGLSEGQSEAILAAQMPLLEKASKASIVIWNDGDLEVLESQIDLVITQIFYDKNR